jgi:hypothetical protein
MMNKSAVSIILNNLLQDLTYFSIFALIVGILTVLYIAGAKLLEIKGMDRWPAFFAVLPVFWLLAAVFDPRPEKSRALTQRFSLIFGLISIGLVILVIKVL